MSYPRNRFSLSSLVVGSDLESADIRPGRPKGFASYKPENIFPRLTLPVFRDGGDKRTGRVVKKSSWT